MAALPSITPRLPRSDSQSASSRRSARGGPRRPRNAAVAPASLDAVQRTAPVDHRDAAIRLRGELFATLPDVDDAMLARFVAALDGPRDLAAGEVAFRNKCATCHQAHGIGVAVGPDLTAEFQRAESTLVKDILCAQRHDLGRLHGVCDRNRGRRSAKRSVGRRIGQQPHPAHVRRQRCHRPSQRRRPHQGPRRVADAGKSRQGTFAAASR